MSKVFLFLGTIPILLAVFIAGEAKAFTCTTSDGKVIPPGGSSTPVPVKVKIGPNLIEGKNEISTLTQITCKNDFAGWRDILKINAAVFYRIEFLFNGGMTIKGTDYDIIPGGSLGSPIEVINVGNLASAMVPIQLFIKIGKKPERDVLIKKDERIGAVYFEQRNDQPGCPKCGMYIWELIADNDAYFAMTSCTINGSRQINVDFGNISQDKFTTNASQAVIKKDQSIYYYCDDRNVSQDIQVRLVASTSNFSSEAIKTTNDNLGVVMMYKGNVIKPNQAFTSRVTNGVGNDTLTFVPVKKNVSSDKIVTGVFSGSATLIFSAP